jgi:hypothetical protein
MRVPPRLLRRRVEHLDPDRPGHAPRVRGGGVDAGDGATAGLLLLAAASTRSVGVWNGNYARTRADNEEDDPATGRWRLRAAMPMPQSGIAAATRGGRLFVFGGEAPTGTFDRVDAYDPSNDAWTTWPPMPTPRHGLGAPPSATGSSSSWAAPADPTRAGTRSPRLSPSADPRRYGPGRMGRR